jgi:hypothetical protein
MKRFGSLRVREQSLYSCYTDCRSSKHRSSWLGGCLGSGLCALMRWCGVFFTEAPDQCEALIQLGYRAVEFVELCLYPTTPL